MFARSFPIAFIALGCLLIAWWVTESSAFITSPLTWAAYVLFVVAWVLVRTRQRRA